MLCGILAAIVALVGTFTTAVEITSDTAPRAHRHRRPPDFRTGTWMLDDLADNMSIAILIAARAARDRRRRPPASAGAGVRGSPVAPGLALTGLVALAIGLAQFPIDAAREFAAIPNEQEFVLTITRDVGYWLLLASAALGLLVFFASINDAFGDRRSGLNPWIAALGALATVVAVLGPMIPEGTAIFSDNWYLREGPGQPSALLLLGRLVQLALLGISGIAGYLCVRRWGLAVAIGGALPIVWLAASTLFDLTDTPVGPAFANPGADEIELHGVTIIGVSAVVAIGILAVVAAYDQSVSASGVRQNRGVTPIELRSDNTAAVVPEILAAVAAANEGTALAYGGDELTTQLEAVVREVFEHPTARVFPVTSGTAANALSLSALCPPWGSVLCHESAHILNSECAATSLLGGGAAIRGIPGRRLPHHARLAAGRARQHPLGRSAPLATGGAVVHATDRHGHDLLARRHRGGRRSRQDPRTARPHRRGARRQRARRRSTARPPT